MSLSMMGASLFLQCEAFEAYPSPICQGAACLDLIEVSACDQSLAPNVPEASVVHVSPNGSASGTGDKNSPVNSINAALGMLGNGKSNIFVCNGTYNENVVLAGVSNVALYGGFSCDNWTYACGKSAVTPLTGLALEIDNIFGVTFVDMHFEAQKRVGTGESSIAAFVNQSNGVTFKRTEIVAGAAAKGEDGVSGNDGAWDTTPGDAKNATTVAPGQGDSCTCTTGGRSVGGNGGAPAKDGSPGMSDPSFATNPPGNDGAAGIGGTNDCRTTGSGNNGADAPAGSNGDAITLGTLTASGWSPNDGNPGEDGTPGQGGGGGGGNSGSGGGGGCGGCGGTGGTGGTAGGSSIALLSFNSGMQLISCDLSTGQAGNGGAGGDGGSSTAGSGSGNGATVAPNNGCSGGNGGQGGTGGAGGGGAGGISAGILYSGTTPAIGTDTTFNGGSTTDLRGTGGLGGTSGAPTSVAGAAGPGGKFGRMVSADNWGVTQ